MKLAVRGASHARPMSASDARRCPPAHWLHPRLEAEWRHLARRPAAVAAARSWQVTDRPFADLDELLTLAGFGVPNDQHTEAVLRRLVDVARHDELAARIVLQRIVPGLLAQVHRRSRRGVDGVFEELVGWAWVTIREFDPVRRPGCVAAALISGADYRAFGKLERRRSAPESSTDPRLLDDVVSPAPTSSCDELADLVREARLDGVTDDELTIVHQLVDVGSPKRLAAALGVTPRTIRNRRDKVTERLRRVAVAA